MARALLLAVLLLFSFTGNGQLPVPPVARVADQTGTLSADTNSNGRESVRIDPIVELARSNATSRITRCSFLVTVSHELQGRIDPGFRSGTALGIVSREVTLDYIPL